MNWETYPMLSGLLDDHVLRRFSAVFRAPHYGQFPYTFSLTILLALFCAKEIDSSKAIDLYKRSGSMSKAYNNYVLLCCQD